MGGALRGTRASAAGQAERVREAVGDLTEGGIPRQAIRIDVGLVEDERQVREQRLRAAVARIVVTQSDQPFERTGAGAGEPELLGQLVVVRRIRRLDGA